MLFFRTARRGGITPWDPGQSQLLNFVTWNFDNWYIVNCGSWNFENRYTTSRVTILSTRTVPLRYFASSGPILKFSFSTLHPWLCLVKLVAAQAIHGVPKVDLFTTWTLDVEKRIVCLIIVIQALDWTGLGWTKGSLLVYKHDLGGHWGRSPTHWTLI
jgi:hypothetical protein